MAARFTLVPLLMAHAIVLQVEAVGNTSGYNISNGEHSFLRGDNTTASSSSATTAPSNPTVWNTTASSNATTAPSNPTVSNTTASPPPPGICPEATFDYSHPPIYAKITLPGGRIAGSTVELEHGSAGRQVGTTCASLEWTRLTFSCDGDTLLEWNLTRGYVRDDQVPLFCDKWDTGYGYITNPDANEEYLQVVDTTFLAACPAMEVTDKSVKFDLPANRVRGDVMEFTKGRVQNEMVRGVCEEVVWTDHAFQCDIFRGEWTRLFGTVSKVELTTGCSSSNGTWVENGTQPFLEVLGITQAPPTLRPSTQAQIGMPSGSPADLTDISVPASTPPTTPLPTRMPSTSPTEEPSTEEPQNTTTTKPTMMPTPIVVSVPLNVTAAPTTSPTLVVVPIDETSTPTSKPTSTEGPVYCGCTSCNQAAWERLADSFTCGDRIVYLMSLGHPETDACRQIAAAEHPKSCFACNPDICEASLNSNATLALTIATNTATTGKTNEGNPGTPSGIDKESHTYSTSSTMAPSLRATSSPSTDTEEAGGSLVVESDAGATVSNVVSAGQPGMLVSYPGILLMTTCSLFLIGLVEM